MRVCLISDIFIIVGCILKISFLQLPQTGYKFIGGLAKLGIMHLDQDYTIATIACKGGFPLSRNFYVRTDVNLNWLYVRKLK